MSPATHAKDCRGWVIVLSVPFPSLNLRGLIGEDGAPSSEAIIGADMSPESVQEADLPTVLVT